MSLRPQIWSCIFASGHRKRQGSIPGQTWIF